MPTKIFVGNLPDNCPKDSLQDLFGPYGRITELDIIKNYAFVHFANEEDANNAMRDLDKTKLLGQEITVQVSKHQSSKPNQRRDNRDHRDDRRPQQRNRGSSNGPINRGGPPPSKMGGILGASPLGQPPTPALAGGQGIGNLGIFSAVNTLAAVEQQQKRNEEMFERDRERERRPSSPAYDQYRERERASERTQPDPRREVHTDSVQNTRPLSLSNGYVIYERYYVDPSHPLLKGLPIPELPRMTDTYVAREVAASRPAPYSRNDDRGYKERSPLTERDDLLRERERDYRPTAYQTSDYYDRR